MEGDQDSQKAEAIRPTEPQKDLYSSLQNELAIEFSKLETELSSQVEFLDNKISVIKKRKDKLEELSYFLRDPKEDFYYKDAADTLAFLRAELAKIPKIKKGFPGFRKEVEDVARTTPIKERLKQAENELQILDDKIKESFEENKIKLVLLAKELGISESVEQDEIKRQIDQSNSEIRELEKQKIEAREKFAIKRDNFPIIGYGPDGKRPVIKNVEVREDAPEPNISFMAYGGTRYGWRISIGKDGRSLEGIAGLDSSQGLSKQILSEVLEIKGKKFIVFSQIQDAENDRTYPYTAFFNPGEEILSKAGHNDDVIIRNILQDPVLKHYIMNEPEKFYEMRNILIARLSQSYFEINAL